MTTAFTDIGIGASIIEILQRSNITAPTPVQAEAIPMVLAGRDLIATAPTGTGKTGAFLLPALERLNTAPQAGRGPRMLVLSPTRELAAQIGKAAKQFSEGLQRVKTVTITGGESYQQQNRVLSRPYEILIATPGRLIDQLSSDRIDLSRVELFVLDEADRMLDIGFTDAVLEIAGKLPAVHQTLCFTATMSPEVVNLSGKLLKNPHRIQVGGESHSRENIAQKLIYTDDLSHKQALLQHFFAGEEVTGQAIVFTATRRDADELAQLLSDNGHPAIALHGDLSQKERTRSLNRLRAGESRILVATDVAARGIDVNGISHVFNFDLPKFAEDYVHRIGRTGRAGNSGIAVSFVSRMDTHALRRIERFVGASIEEMQVAGLEGRFRPEHGNSRGGPRGRNQGGGARGGQRQDRGGGGYQNRKPGGAARGDDRGSRQGNGGGDRQWKKDAPRGDRQPSFNNGDRQPRFNNEDRQPRFNKEDRQPSFNNGDRQPRFNNEDRQPRFNKEDRQPRFNDDRQPRFNNDDRQPRFNKEDRQPRAHAGDRQPRSNDDSQPHFYDDRQPTSNENRAPRFGDDRRPARNGAGRDKPARQGGARTGNAGGAAGRAAAGRKGPGGQGGGYRANGNGGNGGNGKVQRGGRRPKQVGLYLPETPVAKPDWRNERLSDAPKKPKVIKVERKGEARREGGGESGGNTWSFTGKTLRLKKGGEE